MCVCVEKKTSREPKKIERKSRTGGRTIALLLLLLYEKSLRYAGNGDKREFFFISKIRTIRFSLKRWGVRLGIIRRKFAYKIIVISNLF